MKKLFCAALVCGALCFAQLCFGQQGAQPPDASRNAGPAADHRSNEQNGVDIDRFMGYPNNKTVHISHAGLLTHSILRNGNPYEPGPQGAVLEYRKDLSTATLLPKSETPLSTLNDEFLFYVKGGEARLDDGRQSWDLRANMAILAPPHVPHRFINTSDKPLEMIMLTFTGGPDAHKELIVRDINKLRWCEENAHWNNSSRCVFSAADGLLQGERMYLVMIQPWAVSEPHSHGPGTEEIWVKVTSGGAVALIGSELREMPEDSAYLVPPTGITDHSNINLSKTAVEWWIYVARGPAQQSGRGGNNVTANAGRGGGGRGPQNPNLSRDVTAATVKGTPLR